MILNLMQLHKLKNNLSWLLSLVALVISITTLTLQFFWKSHDFTANVLNVIGPCDDGELSADIVFVNRGNQDEVVINGHFVFEDIGTKAAIFSEEHIGPLVVKEGEAKVMHLSAEMKRKDILKAVRIIARKDVAARTSYISMETTLKNFKFNAEAIGDSDDKHTIQQGVEFEILNPEGGIINVIYPCLKTKTIGNSEEETTIDDLYGSQTFISLVRSSYLFRARAVDNK
jgi:hypothetical protein